MATKEQILDILSKHLFSAYDNGNINDGGIHGGEEAAEAILKLIQPDSGWTLHGGGVTGEMGTRDNVNLKFTVREFDMQEYAKSVTHVIADENGLVTCPFCHEIHRHGGNGNGTARGFRKPDCDECGDKEYFVVPFNEKELFLKKYPNAG